jgi:hypothetical protein
MKILRSNHAGIWVQDSPHILGGTGQKNQFKIQGTFWNKITNPLTTNYLQ